MITRPSDMIYGLSDVTNVDCSPHEQNEDEKLEMRYPWTCIITNKDYPNGRPFRSYEEHIDIKGKPPYTCSVSIVNYEYFEKLKEKDKRGIRELIAKRGGYSDEEEMRKLRTTKGRTLGTGGIFQHHIYCRPVEST